MKAIFPIIAAVALASACVSTPSYQERYDRYAPYLGKPVDSFVALQRQSWEPINRNQLVLWTTINDAYLLTVTDGCPDLPFTNAVGVTSTTHEISRFDSVIVRGHRCPIQRIQPIDVKQMKADARTGEKSDRSS